MECNRRVPPDRVLSSFSNYVIGMMATSIPAVLSAITNASLRGLGKAQASSYIAIGSAILNVILVSLLANQAGLALTGLVYANAISSTSALLVSTFLLFHSKSLGNIPSFNFCMSHYLMLRYVGIPVFASYCLIFISTFFYNRIVSSFGEQVLAGFGVGYRIQTMVILPGMAIGSAIGIIINHNLADALRHRAYEGFRKGMLHSYFLYLCIAGVLWIWKEPMVSLLIADPLASMEAVRYLHIVAGSFILMGPMLTVLLTKEQTGQGFRALLLNALYFVLIIGIGWILTSITGKVESFYWCIFGVNLAGVLVIIPTFRMYRTKFTVSSQRNMSNHAL
ncbi:MATE family efflux transporter [Paenibacillus sp. Marseille-Q4541]|uniref:MATE family efflux transporter n=1 Tax=Paenibacillus sp. Marseille-Q4541 TaxID=2831522 RepID=UPI001BA8C568|nr:MATE family efflux transporter [Paenibacillus sp. Marseille-Q4541]